MNPPGRGQGVVGSGRPGRYCCLRKSRGGVQFVSPLSEVVALEKEEDLVPKRKTHKGLAKRVKVTATGKLIHRRAGKAHLLSKKSRRRRRRLGTGKELTGGQARIVRRQLGG